MQVRSWDIRPYDAAQDADASFALWQAALGQKWLIGPERFKQILHNPTAQNFVAHEQGQIIGLLAITRSERVTGSLGNILAVLVAPERQRRGIGRALHTRALEYVRQAGLTQVQVGGGWARFWPGVPLNLPAGYEFFRALGWEFREGLIYDLQQDLSNYVTQPAIWSRMAREGISFGFASKENLAAVLEFERREFMNWFPHFQYVAEFGDYQDLLVAHDKANGKVVGTLSMYSTQHSHPDRIDIPWQAMLGEKMGALGCVGVGADERGRGIGIALVARASELLKERDATPCYIDWVEITDFYAKLGYEKWRGYWMSTRDL
ncbi:GNAT family N-acetyltransferase [Ktedonosporobacter rubrisoli]|uniref:GNAT family N-acetyltransferase n=1 Tax=Ktedonosporobacter rubrisoli TaxID=2509675 RepID=A0A4P6JVD0_KTERU|nr:GNAT family N-acetyltransferase [Ktedonosporobacter rubrisoli]QBD79323.1 GNAT family N-acetyltransferase [Ktedonosporobacter rubrisoli]